MSFRVLWKKAKLVRSFSAEVYVEPIRHHLTRRGFLATTGFNDKVTSVCRALLGQLTGSQSGFCNSKFLSDKVKR